MNIGFDSKRAFNNKTGLGNYSRFILNGMLLHFAENGIFAYTPSFKKELIGEFPKNRVFLPLKKSIFWRSFGILNDLKKNKIHIFHGLSNEIPFGLNKAGIKSVITIHDLIFINYPQFYSFFDRIIYRLKLIYALNNADKIIAISQKTKEDILLFKPDLDVSKIEVIYQDCHERFKFEHQDFEIEAVKNKFDLQKPYVISVGTIEERKNQLLLVKAFEALNNIEVDLLLVGRGKKYRQEIETYIKTQNLKNVIILDNVDNIDLPKMYAGALFSAYISRVEGFGIPSIEALSCGISVLTSAGTCLEEAAGGGGLFVDTTSLIAIRNGLDELITNESLRNKLALKGKLHIEQFNQKAIIEQLKAVYNNLFYSITPSAPVLSEI